jgi:tetratricopeptide (TPR) repeat protein
VFADDEVDFVATAHWFEGLAADPHPDDDVSAAMLLVVAGDYLAMAGQHDAALVLFQRAVADGGECTPDARCSLLSGLLEVGREDDAAALAAEIKAARLPDPEVYHHVGNTYETRGDLAAATTWFTAGLVRFLHDDGVDDFAVEQLAVGRSRVREAQGFPMDEYDELAEEMHEAHYEDLELD